MAGGYDAVATAIIAGQRKVIGQVALTLARKVSGVAVDDDGRATVSGDGTTVIEALVKQFSSLTGQLGVRMCFTSAQGELARHPEVKIPSFQRL